MKTVRASGGVWAVGEPTSTTNTDIDTDIQVGEPSEKRTSEPSVLLSDYSSNSDTSSSSGDDDSDSSSSSSCSTSSREDFNQGTNLSAPTQARVTCQPSRATMGSNSQGGSSAETDDPSSHPEPDSTNPNLEGPEREVQKVNGVKSETDVGLKAVKCDKNLDNGLGAVSVKASEETPIDDSLIEGLHKLDTKWGCFGAGEKVFAYWKGNTAYSTGYYPGVIVQKGVLNVYIIHFDDNTKCNTSEVQIIPVQVLGVGTKVFYVPDDIYSGGPLSAQIVGQKMLENGKTQYGVRCFGSDSVVVCERAQIYLSVNEGKELRKKYESVQPKFGDVNLDNVVHGRRQRTVSLPTKSVPVTPVVVPKKGAQRRKSDIPSGGSKSKKSKQSSVKQKQIAKKSPDSTKLCPVDFKNSKKSTPKIVINNSLMEITASKANNAFPLSVAHSKQANKMAPSKILSKSVPAKTSKESVHASVNIQQKRSPEVVTKTGATVSFSVHKNVTTSENESQSTKQGLFHGYYFYLTAGDRSQLKGIDLGNYSKDIPKAEMLRMILSEEGKEIASIKGEIGKDPTRVFLLASSHLRTLKYLYCTATGIPCVAQRWIKACLSEKKVVDWKPYQLYPGWNVRENRLALPHKNWPLQGLTIGLATFKKDVISTWSILVPAAKGRLLVSKDFSSSTHPTELKIPDSWLDGQIDILVSDFHCPSSVHDLLKAKSIPLVRIEWLVETITIGEKADYRVGEGGVDKSSKQAAS